MIAPQEIEYVWNDRRRTGMVRAWSESQRTFGPPRWKQSVALNFLFESVLPLLITAGLLIAGIMLLWSVLGGLGLASSNLRQTFWGWVLLAIVAMVFLSFVGKGSPAAGQVATKEVWFLVRLAYRIPVRIFRWVNRGLNEAVATWLLGGRSSQPPVPVYQFELRRIDGTAPSRRQPRSLTDLMYGEEDERPESPQASTEASVQARIYGFLDTVMLQNGDVVALEGRTDPATRLFHVERGIKYNSAGGSLAGGTAVVIRLPQYARQARP